MSIDSALGNLELSILCMLGSFYVTVIVLLAIFLHLQFRKKSYQLRKDSTINMSKLNTSAKMLSSVQTVFHFKNSAFTLKESEDSKINYSAMFRNESQRLALKINSITIGGRTQSLKPHMTELKELFFLIQLNNNITNSIILSDVYNFSSNLFVDELFLFSLKDFELSTTTVVIEVFVTLTGNKNELFLGWVEIKLPNDVAQYPIRDGLVLREVSRPIDLYLKPVAHVCICLTNLDNKIKIVLLATSISNTDWGKDEDKDVALFFNVQIKVESDSSLVHACKTSRKVFSTTIVWNEVFFFDVPNRDKRKSFFTIELWRSCVKISINSKPPEVVGNIKLGQSDEFPEKSQMHWKYMLDYENEENSRWHPVRSIE